jgi:hypothetical protein
MSLDPLLLLTIKHAVPLPYSIKTNKKKPSNIFGKLLLVLYALSIIFFSTLPEAGLSVSFLHGRNNGLT